MTAIINPRRCARTMGTLSGIIGLAIAAPAVAQTALDTATVSVPSERMTPSTDLTLLKETSTGGFAVTVINTGPDAVTGVIVADKAGSGRLCPAGNAVTITGNGVPVGSFKIANLTGPGIALGTLSSGQSATLTYSCQVN